MKNTDHPIANTTQIHLLDLVICLSDTMDLISPDVVNHHKQVAYIALNIAGELKLSAEQTNNIVMAAALHDIGAISLKDRLSTLCFEMEAPHRHAELGYYLLKMFEPFSGIATLVRFHHTAWNNGNVTKAEREQIPVGSFILHLADRVAVLINRKKEITGQIQPICSKIEALANKTFMPEQIDALKRLAKNEYFWHDIVSSTIGTILSLRAQTKAIEMDIHEFLSLANMLRRIIDFRCRFTATHSSGVAACAEGLARLANFTDRMCLTVRIAGYLHDLGKIAIPSELLEKSSKLLNEEFSIIQNHVLYTHNVLSAVKGLEVINSWASFHHERLDGKGYPFQLRDVDLPAGSRILAVADVFTAITEDRPYRKGMSRGEALQVIQKMVIDSALDTEIVSLLIHHYDTIDALRLSAQSASIEEYRQFLKLQSAYLN